VLRRDAVNLPRVRFVRDFVLNWLLLRSCDVIIDANRLLFYNRRVNFDGLFLFFLLLEFHRALDD